MRTLVAKGMFLRAASILLCVIASSLASIPTANATALVVGGLDEARGGDYSIVADTYNAGVTRLVFEEVAPGVSFTSTNVLTSEYLDTVDVVFLSGLRTPTTTIVPLTLAEQNALFNFVSQGGRALIATEYISVNTGAYESLLSPFGLTPGGTASGKLTFTDPNHPVVNGPYGQVTDMIFPSTGIFPVLGPYATALGLVGGDPNLVAMAVIEADAIAPGSGRVIFLGDGDFTNFNINSVEQIAALGTNGAHYLAAIPEPSSMTLMGMGTLLSLLAVCKRRRC